MAKKMEWTPLQAHQEPTLVQEVDLEALVEMEAHREIPTAIQVVVVLVGLVMAEVATVVLRL